MRFNTPITLPASIRSCGDLAPLLGAGFALVLVALYGRPLHAMGSFWAMSLATGLGVTIGFHRLFAHRSFITTRWSECLFMILGCMAGMGSPFAWIANHRIHHRNSDQEGDPRAYHIRGRGFFGVLAEGWELYLAWLRDSKESYSPSAIKDLASRPDLAWIDRHWFKFFLLGLTIPAGIGFLIGETAYDALIGFAWGGLFRQFAVLNLNFLADALNHQWGSQDYVTGDHSRNNFVLGLLAFGEGWHNNHHAFPYSARHGFHWWQPDLGWSMIWLMEHVGLAWRVKRPKLVGRRATVLAQAAFANVADRMQMRKYSKGEVIIRQGDAAEEFFLIGRGSAGVTMQVAGEPERSVATLAAGDVFGEMALLTDEPRNATVRALEEMEVYCLRKDDFREALDRAVGFKEQIRRIYSDRYPVAVAAKVA